MMPLMPEHTIFNSGRRFLRLKVEVRVENDQREYRLVLEGDAATKELSAWSTNFEATVAAFDEERARYR